MDLEDIDLNLLIVFRQLLIQKRVSKVADHLGLTQPAVSNALGRLRKLLGDELFARTPQGMEPTPYAEQLAESVTYALSMIHSALNHRVEFSPESARKVFTIGMTDVGEIWFLPKLLSALTLAAPKVSLEIVRNAAVDLRDDMESGRVDLAIGLLPQLKAGFFQRRLLNIRHVCVVRKGHHLDGKKLTVSDFYNSNHIAVISHGTGHGQVDEIMEKNGIKRNIAITVPHFTSVAHILQNSDFMATIPEPLALRIMEPFDLVSFVHPVKLPDLPINLFWHARVNKDSANIWIRKFIFDTLR